MTCFVTFDSIGCVEIVGSKGGGSIAAWQSLYATVGANTGTKFQVGYELGIFHKLLVFDSPAQRKSGERTPAVALTEQ